MKKIRLLGAVWACVLAFIATNVNSALIVDTGPAPVGSSSWTLSPGQYLAAEFSINSKATITDIEGWMRNTVQNRKGIIAIYSDRGDVPSTEELFSATFFGNGSSVDSWVGLNGLSWLLDAGTYWVSFESRFGSQELFGTSMPYSSLNPSVNEAFRATDAAGDLYPWQSYDMGIGVRISGDVTAVPIPAAAWLFGTGLVGLLAMARRKRAV